MWGKDQRCDATIGVGKGWQHPPMENNPPFIEPGKSTFSSSWQSLSVWQSDRDVGLTLSSWPAAGESPRQLSAVRLAHEFWARVPDIKPGSKLEHKTKETRGISRPVLSQISVAYPQSKTLWCSSVADETSDLKSGWHWDTRRFEQRPTDARQIWAIKPVIQEEATLAVWAFLQQH